MTATNSILPLERLDAQPDRAFIQEESSFASTTQARRLACPDLSPRRICSAAEKRVPHKKWAG